MKDLAMCMLMVVSSVSCFSQNWKISGDTLIMKEGTRFYEGDKVKIGYGSGLNKEFAFITTSPYSLAGKRGMDRSYANLNMTIKEIRVLKNKRFGDKVFLLLKGVALVSFWCDVEAAIDQRELIVD